MAEIVLTDVKKVYKKGQKPAVADFNLTIRDKEFVVFVGPSGCGKSTTLRMIAGLEDISDGTIEIDGRVVNDLSPKDRGVAMVFQNYALYPSMTVFKNIAFPLTLLKIPTLITKRNGKQVIKRKKLPVDEIKKRVIAVAETLGITEYLNRRPRELSGGQRQRVAIGRAMVRDSKVFLLDEPLSNLDAKLRNEMRAELIELRSKINSTFVYVTHDQTEAMTLGDRIVVMRDGHIQQVGTPTEVFDMPSNLFVAGFIGSPQMNLFKTRLERDDNGYYVSPCGVKIYVNGEKGEALKNRNTEEQEITLGVRPEHIALTKRDDPTAIPCTVRVKEMMGSELHIHAVTSTGEQVIARIPTMRLTLQQINMFGDGVEVYITFREKAMHFFGERENNLLVDSAYIPPQEENAQEVAASEEEPQGQKRKHWRHMKSEGDKEKL